jgi:hypothetical protein
MLTALMLIVEMLTVVMLTVVMLNVAMLTVTVFMLRVVMLNVTVLSVVAPYLTDSQVTKKKSFITLDPEIQRMTLKGPSARPKPLTQMQERKKKPYFCLSVLGVNFGNIAGSKAGQL